MHGVETQIWPPTLITCWLQYISSDLLHMHLLFLGLESEVTHGLEMRTNKDNEHRAYCKKEHQYLELQALFLEAHANLRMCTVNYIPHQSLFHWGLPFGWEKLLEREEMQSGSWAHQFEGCQLCQILDGSRPIKTKIQWKIAHRWGDASKRGGDGAAVGERRKGGKGKDTLKKKLCPVP